MYHGEVTGIVIKVIKTERISKKVKGDGFRDGGKYEIKKIIVRHNGSYNTVGVYTFFTDRFNKIPEVVEADEVGIKFTVEAREYKDNWYLNAMIKELDIIKSVDVTSTRDRGNEIRERELLEGDIIENDNVQHRTDKDDLPF